MATITGGCLCGAVRYSYEGDIGPANYCHCADCRRTSGSAFGTSVRLLRATFTIVSGEPRGFSKIADSGNELTRHFCPSCGSPLYTTSERHPDHLFAKAGSLDDATLVHPAHQSWTASRVPWATIPDTLTTYERGRK